MAGQHRKQRGLRWIVLAVSYALVGVFSTVKGVGVSFAEFRFLEEPSDTVVSKDGPALLNCSAAGEPKPTISWKREGALLHLINDPRRSILSNGSLHFRSVHHTRAERPDEGVYQCVATISNVGTMLSRSQSCKWLLCHGLMSSHETCGCSRARQHTSRVQHLPCPQQMLFG